MKCRKNKGRKTRTRTKLTKGMGLGIHDSIPRRTRLLLDSATGHFDHPQALPQAIDLDRGDREVATRQVAFPLL